MFKGSKLHGLLYNLGKRFTFYGAAASMVTGIIIQLPQGKAGLDHGWPHLIVRIYSWLTDQSLWLFLLAIAFWVIGQLLVRTSDPSTREHIQFLLDEFQKGAFHSNGDAVHHHRITLFQHKPCWFGYWRSKAVRSDTRWWPWGTGYRPCSGWLIPVMRSGHTSTKMRTAFIASRDEPDKTEGVAGMAWANRCEVFIPKLPVPNAQNKTEYAKKTCTPIGLVERYMAERVPMARSFGAVPVEVNNKLWGVIVLDSRNPTAVTKDLLANYTVTIMMISRLLERGI